jgi:hypothetical protein
MTTSGTHLCRLIERARRQQPGALDRLLDAYRNYLRLLARTGLDASLQGKAHHAGAERGLRAERRGDGGPASTCSTAAPPA